MGRFVILLLCAAPVLAAPVPKALQKATPTIVGVWEVVERQNDATPLNSAGREYWVIDESTDAIYDGVKDVSAIVDPTVKPYQSRWKHTDNDATAFDTGGGPVQNIGRMELDGDTLRIGFAIGKVKIRPAEAKPVVGVAYILFKRVDDPRAKAK